jgi:hypothetical protein
MTNPYHIEVVVQGALDAWMLAVASKDPMNVARAALSLEDAVEVIRQADAPDLMVRIRIDRGEFQFRSKDLLSEIEKMVRTIESSYGPQVCVARVMAS